MSESEDDPIDRDLSFIKAIISFPVLFERCQTPSSKIRKKEAIVELQATLPAIIGKEMTEAQILKKIQNLKQKLKKKADRKASGKHGEMVLTDGEQLLFAVWGGECNPSIQETEGSMSESDMSVAEESCSQDYVFVKVTLAHPIMMDRSQTPEVRMAKKEAVEAIQSTLAGLLNKQMTSDQIFKKFNNLKTIVRKKILLKKAGNKHVVFSDGEQLLLDVMEGNSAAIQISDVISVEGTINPNQKQTNNVESTMYIQENPLPSKKRHSDPIFDYETEETKKLSNLELQRMALLLQIDYLRSKKARLPSQKNIKVYDANGNLIEIETQPIQICSFKQK